jgi:GrpB-like predicted nucleotidyltransferase (UPF0157 family)
VDPTERVELTPWRPEWADEFASLATELHGILEMHVRRIDHIGSTSVPHLPAKDIIDIQIIVETLDNPNLLDALGKAGYTQRTQPWNLRDHIPAGWEGDVHGWDKLVFAPPASARLCNVHVRVIGSPNERYALLFRDFLRSSESARAAWGHLKEALSSVTTNWSEYGSVKDPATDVLMVAAEQWARSDDWSVPTP